MNILYKGGKDNNNNNNNNNEGTQTLKSKTRGVVKEKMGEKCNGWPADVWTDRQTAYWRTTHILMAVGGRCEVRN